MVDPHLLGASVPSLGIFFAAILALLACASSAETAEPPQAADLTTEHRTDPLGIDAQEPRLSWRFVQDGRGRRQSAYRIQVAREPEALESGQALLDTGKVESPQSLSIPLKGLRPVSGMRYWWRVKVWDADGREGPWSPAAFFEMGLLRKEDWEGVWITSPIGGNGYHSATAADQDTEKWVQLDLGASREVAAVTLFPARPYNWNEDRPGFGFPVRYRVEVSDDAGFRQATVVADRTTEDQPNPGETPVEIRFEPVSARYVRLTATRLYTRQDGQKLLALAELQVAAPSGEVLSAGRPAAALDSIEAHGWSVENLTEGITRSTAPSRIAPLFRREFTLERPVRRARAYVCGLGYYELRLNGRKVGDHVLDPAYTNFEKRSYYSTYDVTDLLRVGPNAVGAILGKGWWGRSPTLIVQINIEHDDGSRTSVCTDADWKRSQSPILDNSLYHGETYDARLEQDGWDLPGFDDSGWEKAVVAPEWPTRQLSAQTIQPIRVTETLTFKSMKPGKDCWVFDFGQNFSGWCRLTVAGPAGNVITLKHAELLYPDGTVNQENLRSAKATDTYITRGKGTEIYEPRFTYHGFRYVQLEGFPGHPSGWDVLKGRVVHTDMPPRGTFECSNELLNQIHRNSCWGFRTNFHSIPTDCPQRDERQGWMGDAGMTSDMGLYNFDAAAAYNKFLQDIADAQGEDGRIPDTVPHIWGTNPGDPMWSAAYHFIVRDMYRHTGDRTLLERHYDGMKRYVQMLEREARDYIITRNNYGDWVGVVETPKDLISTGSFILVSRIVADTAETLGKQDDARYFRDLSARITEAFNARFLDRQTAVYGNGSQYSYVWPLCLKIVPPELHSRVVENLVHDIMVTHRGHLSTGFLGARYMFEVLCDEGHADVAYTIMNQRDYPSYGYMIEMGATTIWELWKYETGPGMNSHNHPAFGFISGWFYSDIAGIVPTWEGAGFARFDIKPHLMGDLKNARASVDTVRGRVSSSWEREGSTVRLEVTVPANSTADVWVPLAGGGPAEVFEGGKPVWRDGAFVPGVPGISAGQAAGRWIRFEAGSGHYRFESRS